MTTRCPPFLALLLLSLPGCEPASSSSAEEPPRGETTSALVYTGPLQITRGGTYSGNWKGTDSTPAVEINTTEPVVIENCNVTGTGPLIRSWARGGDITVRNCNGFVMDPPAGAERGQFVSVANVKRLAVLNNYFEKATKGVMVYQDETAARANTLQSVRVVGNVGRNADDKSQQSAQNGTACFASFVQFNRAIAVPDVEIAWNQFINEPEKSCSADSLNFFNSSGTAASPMRVHDNFLQGAFPHPNAASDAFTGTGMTTDGYMDGSLPPEQLVVAYLDASNNTVLSTGNAAMNMAGGHHIRFHHNRLVTSGYLPDRSGRKLASSWAGTASWNNFNHPPTLYGNNSIDSNTIGFVTWKTASHRQDVWTGCAADTCHDNTSMPGPITVDTEQNEWNLWNAKLSAQGRRIGSAEHFNSGAAVQGNGGNPLYPSAAPVSCGGTGGVTLRRWDNVDGTLVSQIPLSSTPSLTQNLSAFEIPVNSGDRYGTRLSAWICTSVSGAYTFYIAGDDNAELYLSTDEHGSNKRRIAHVPGWTDSRQINKYAEQRSASITLVAGKRYFVEALHKEGAGGDNLSVGWDMPDGTREFPLPGSRLVPTN